MSVEATLKEEAETRITKTELNHIERCKDKHFN